MKKLTLVTLMTAAGLLSPKAHAGYDIGDWLNVAGFGTIGAYQSNNDNVRVRPDARAIAGSEGDLRFDGDTLFGLQGTVNPTGPVKGVIQMVSHKKVDGTTLDGSWRPLTEWAYVGWDATPTLNFKLGRVVAPLFMTSDTRNLGYAQTSVRPPQTVYALNPITNLDGATASWDSNVGDTALTLTGLYGKTSVAVSTGQFKVNNVYGGALKAASGDWTARVSYTHFAADVTLVPTKQAAYDAAASLPFCTNCSEAIPGQIPLSDVHVRMFAYGLMYEHDDYTVQGEYVNRFGSTLAAADATGWYLQGAKRIGDWTPYVRYGEVSVKDSIDLQPTSGATAGQRAYLAGLNDMLVFGDVSRSELAFGLRWDIAPKLAIKLEYNMYKVLKPLHGTGPVVNYPIAPVPPTAQAAAFDSDKGRVNLLTLNLDFVF